MSVKLGNTNIAGTQVLYSTTGNNTDGAMTQAAVTTVLNNKADNSVVNLKANDNAVVHLTGNETINGVKTFNNAINLANATWNAVGDDAFIGDFNHAGAVCIKGNNGKTQLKLINRNETIGLGFFIDEDDGNALKLITPYYNATAWGSVTAMVAQDLSSGYVKYNNGLIIQWGYSQATNSRVTVTLPTPFMTNNYSVTLTVDRNSANELFIPEKDSTSFKWDRNGGIGTNAVYWLAIGY